MNILKNAARKAVGVRVPPPPFQAAEAVYTMAFSVYDDVSGPSDRLIDLAVEAVRATRAVSMHELASRPEAPARVCTWPGEHYRLLAGLVHLLQPRVAIDIGTLTGLSALALKQYLPPGGKVVTFDICDWRSLSDTVLQPRDFADGQLVQHVADLSDPAVMEAHAAELAQAGLVFLDGPHDGETERRMLAGFERVPFAQPPLFVLDDIRLWHMLRLWREVRQPKLDVTSFGHWSGTGFVEWPAGARADR